MTTRNIVVLAMTLVAAGIALTLIFGREVGIGDAATNQSQERLLDPSNCLAPATKLFWRLTPIA